MIQNNNNSKEFAVVEELTWKGVRDDIKHVLPAIVSIIDDLNPGNKYSIFKVRYPYGFQILKNGNLFLPGNKGGCFNLTDVKIPLSIQEKLGYNLPAPPVMLTLQNAFEIFIPLQNRIIPYFIMQPGSLIGFWQVLDAYTKNGKSFDSTSMWEITAGARSIFILPKISEELRHDKLQRAFCFSTAKPKEFSDQWHIFRALYKHSAFNNTWEAEMLFFSKEWFEHLNDPAWKDFKLFMFDYNWQCLNFRRDRYAWNLIISQIQAAKKIKPSAYHSDIVKHLFSIGIGATPGFAAAIDDSLAPVSRIQEIYQEVYGLKTWHPVILTPKFFSTDTDRNPVYYSLQHQSAFELTPKAREKTSVIQDIYMVCTILEKYLQELDTDYLNIKSTTLYNQIAKTKFDFFHSDISDYSKIKCSKLISEEDNFFMYSVTDDSRKFPINSLFFNGCIKISGKN